MRAVVRRAMEDGAFGIGSALIYPPGNYATTEELIEMAKAMSPYGGIYITHMRSEADQLLEAIDEAIAIGRKGGVPVEIYHLKAAGTSNWPKGPRVDRQDRLGAHSGRGHSGEHVPVHRRAARDSRRARRRGLGGRKADRQSPEHGDAREDPAEMDNPTTEWENLCQLARPAGRAGLELTKPRTSSTSASASERSRR